MAAFQAQPGDLCLLFLLRVLFLSIGVDVFFVFVIAAILTTRPVWIPREFLEKSLFCSLLDMPARRTCEKERKKNRNNWQPCLSHILWVYRLVTGCHDNENTEFFTWEVNVIFLPRALVLCSFLSHFLLNHEVKRLKTRHKRKPRWF